MDISNATLSMVPLPRVDINQENISDILGQAMEAELAAERFYMAMAEKMEKESHVRIMEYLARMEWRHYHMLKSEMETMKVMEDSMEYNEFMHIGP